MLAGWALEQGSRPVATLIGHGRRVAAVDAARANGAAMHVLDYEPMWNPANHSLSTVLPAVLALAEWLAARPPARARPTGADLLAAVVIGIEAQQRVRTASSQFEPGELMFHPPGAVGAFGSAAACGQLLGMDARTLTQALGIAASRVGGVQANTGSMTKALHCGQAAMAGLEAALLAARGFTADDDALGHPRGYGRAFYGARFEPAALLARRAAPFLLEPGPAFKYFPSQYGSHFVIVAALAARAELAGVRSAEIAAVRIVAPAMTYTDRPRPASGLDGKFSFQYVAAIALLDGKVDVASFADVRRFSADVEQLLPRIVIDVDPAREGRFDRMRVDVIVTTAGGREARGACDGPPGIWGRPAPAGRLAAKAADCLSELLDEAAADAFLVRARSFPTLSADAVCELLAVLGTPHATAQATAR
ncbi:MAG: MmgE/PrpD family protein [Lautropia sp.]